MNAKVKGNIVKSICLILQNFISTDCVSSTYVIDVLWGQRIKLIQVASNSELRENQWKDHLFFEIVPSHCFGASEASNIKRLKNGQLFYGQKKVIPAIVNYGR